MDYLGQEMSRSLDLVQCMQPTCLIQDLNITRMHVPKTTLGSFDGCGADSLSTRRQSVTSAVTPILRMVFACCSLSRR